MLKFYFNGLPNPTKVALYLEESGLPYEPVKIDTRKGEQFTPDYLKINPNAKVPAIDDNGTIVFDSNAILLYLAEKTGKFLPSASVRGETLSEMAEGWALLLEPELDREALERFAGQRGGILFTAAGRLLGADGDPLSTAGQGWALADLTANLSDAAAAEAARSLAGPLLARALGTRWSRPGRPLGALAHLARLDLEAPGRPGSPRRVGRLLWHRLSGR